jgi:hypothetical protein
MVSSPRSDLKTCPDEGDGRVSGITRVSLVRLDGRTTSLALDSDTYQEAAMSSSTEARPGGATLHVFDDGPSDEGACA